jgi:eukaryotic-like serine/threonine-protein kinase
MRRFLLLVILMALYIPFNHAQEPPTVAQYRGSAARDGYYPAHGIPTFNGVKWKKTLDTSGHTPVYADGTLYVPTIGGAMLALDGETGEQLWRYNHGEMMSSAPVVVDGVVYFGGGNYGLYALSAENGELLWSFKTDSAIWSSPPMMIENILYLASDKGTIYALDPVTHEPVWTVANGDPIIYSGAGDESAVYFSSWTTLYAFDRKTGTQLWTAETRNKWMAPAVYDGVVYVGNGRNEFLALDGTTGERIWRFQARHSASEWSAPVVTEDTVYVGHSSKALFALNRADGKQIWRLPVDHWATTDAMFDGGLLYFGVGAHGPDAALDTPTQFYVVRSTTGEIRWTFDIPGLVYSAPALADHTVYVVTTMGEIYAFE